MTRLWRAIVGLGREQVRSLFAVAMLAGIVALSAQGWAAVALIHHVAHTGTFNRDLFNVLIFVLRWTFYLIAGGAACVALVVFGADWLRAKYGSAEIDLGRGGER